MSSLQVNARLKVHAGKLNDFKEVAARCMASVREQDSGTLQYDWFMNDDESECIVTEVYRDSAAVFEHISNLGETLGALTAVADMELEILGSPSAELATAAAQLGARIYAPFQSI